MPGVRCAVYGCNNNQIAINKSRENIKFHAFPKGKNVVSKTIISEWVNRCKREDNFNPSTHRICSIHFNENDYERDMRNELLGLPIKKRLKSTAVPTLHLPSMNNQVITDRVKRHASSTSHNIFTELLKNDENKSEQPGTSKTRSIKVSEEQSEKLKYEKLLVEHTKLKNDYLP